MRRRTALIRRRKALGFSQISLSQVVECNRTTVQSWELGKSHVTPEYRPRLATALQLSLPELDALLNGEDDPANLSQGWWSNYETLEQSANTVRTWQPILVPGLLQTREYASAILQGRDALLARRMQRQGLVARVQLSAVIDESALHRPFGGRLVLAGQLRHLVEMNRRGNVTVQVLPLVSPSHPGDWGAFTILEFAWPGGLVYLQHEDGSHSLDASHDVRNHVTLFERLQSLALSPAESDKLMVDRSKELAT
jgi:transcriptional regulator with XRE-family HTH domain